MDSRVLAFEIAARAAELLFSQLHQVLCAEGRWMMKVDEVVTPEEYMGDVIGDLNSPKVSVAWTNAERHVLSMQWSLLQTFSDM